MFWIKKNNIESEEYKKLAKEIMIIKQDIERIDMDLLLWKKKLKGVKLGKIEEEDKTKDIYNSVLLPE